MSQTFQSTEGIVLRVIPFRDYDQILFLFTLDAGFIKVLYKGGRGKRKGKQGFCMPLTKVEVIYREKRGEIFSCHELTCIESFSFLRQELIFLEVGCDLLQIILDSQFVGKAAPHLYALLCFYLKKIPQTANPWILASSFRLKLLMHDGLIVCPFICCECQQSLQSEAFTWDAEGWCAAHQPGRSQPWNLTELQMLYRLAICQSYQEVCSQDVLPSLQNKIIDFFNACIRR